MNSLGEQVAFFSLAALTLISGFFVVARTNIVHAGFWLLPCFVGIAGLFATLEAHFFFVIQLLLYAGAILVLILFALMLTRDVMNPLLPQQNRLIGWAALLCAAFVLGAVYVFTQTAWALSPARPADTPTQVVALGKGLIGLYAVPFEVASLLLLSALIGAIVIAKVEREPAPAPPPLPVMEEGIEEREVVEVT